jgi:hypothetical protein
MTFLNPALTTVTTDFRTIYGSKTFQCDQIWEEICLLGTGVIRGRKTANYKNESMGLYTVKGPRAYKNSNVKISSICLRKSEPLLPWYLDNIPQIHETSCSLL